MKRACIFLLIGCGHPGFPDQQVGYRTIEDGGATSGERGTVKITEIMWSGSVRGLGDEKSWDPSDVFIELRNEGSRAMNLSGWELRVEGSEYQTYVIPDSDFILGVGQEAFIAAKADGCFTNASWLMPELELPLGDPFRIQLRDRDERLMEPAGSRTAPPFAGGYDLVSSRSMERVNLMFGGQGSEPMSWHYYNVRPCSNSVIGGDPANLGLNCFEEQPNNSNVVPECRRHTMASPGKPNSPDYSGAFSSGGFE